MAVCIPEAGGVPGLGNQAPTWPEIGALTGNHVWDRAAPSTSVPLGLDDPRWRGSLTIGFPDTIGGTEGAGFRALYDNSGGNSDLYLSWWVRADTGPPADDYLYVGFERAAGDPFMLEIRPFLSATPEPGNIAAQVTPFTVSATGIAQNWTENGGVDPSWIAANTHVWLDGGGAWGVQMRVPIGNAGVDTELDLADTFGFWFEIRVDPAAGMAIPHNYPRGAAPTSWLGIPPALNVPDPATWEDFSIDPACVSTGVVSLAVMDVGTQNSPNSEIQYTAPPAANTHVNVFEAKPENNTGASIGPGGIEAQFRIADWGSTISATGPWTPITATGGTNPASNGVAIPDGTKATDITFEWQLDSGEINDFETGVKRRHQCLLVTLTGAGLTFNPASVYRNMDFEHASRFEREATISNVGMREQYPVSGPARPAYILVEKLNMPAEREGDGPFRPSRVARGQEAPPDPDAALAAAHKAGSTELERLEAGEPTIRYHVYHDTGQTVIDKDGKTDRVLAGGIPFGYFMRHDGGEVAGWNDDIVGAVRIAERLYELTVPVEGTAKISTVVEAREGKVVPPQGCGRWIALIVAAVRRLFRSG